MSDTPTPLVAAVDPRTEVRANLFATRQGMEARRTVLEAQIKILEGELAAVCDTIGACVAAERDLTEALENAQRRALED